MIEESIRQHGSIESRTRSIQRNPNGWGGDTTLTVDTIEATGEVAHISMNFNGTRCSGVDIEELRRFKGLLNSFDCI